MLTTARNVLSTRPATTQAICPTAFLNFFHGSLGAAQPTPSRTFSLPEHFPQDVAAALAAAPLDKSPGPDGVSTRMLVINLEAATLCIAALWAAAGRLAHLPLGMRMGTVVPVYKKGDRSQLNNYRPITLISTTRRIISSAVDRCVRRTLSFHPRQWGFRRQTGTEHALAFLAAQRKKGLQHAFILDLKGAYDRVPRDKLIQYCAQRLDAQLSGMVATLLRPGLITSTQDATNALPVTVGVPQGDPISPTLFNIYMDVLLHQVDAAENKHHGTISCFADDVLLVAKCIPSAQRLLDVATSWADSHGMTWSTSKCEQLTPTGAPSRWGDAKIAGAQIKQASMVRYLGVQVDWNGVSSSSIPARISKARRTLAVLRSAPALRRYNYEYLRRVTRTYILPLIDYALPLSPCPATVLSASATLDRETCAWILGVPVPSAALARARALCRLSSIKTRRSIRAGRLIQRAKQSLEAAGHAGLRSELILQDETATAAADDVADLLEETPGRLTHWAERRTWMQANTGRRKIPLRGKLPPLMKDLPRKQQRTAALFYLNALPGIEWLRLRQVKRDRLRDLLTAERIQPPQAQEVEALITELRDGIEREVRGNTEHTS